MKDSYTTREVVQMLVNNNNRTMELLDDNKKFVIEGNEVLCYRVNWIRPNTVLSRYSFDDVIKEVL